MSVSLLISSLIYHHSSLRTRQLNNLWENWRAKACNRIPTLRNRETSHTTTLRATGRDICESLVSLLVQPWVHPSECRLA
jgi:hypothetical protein